MGQLNGGLKRTTILKYALTELEKEVLRLIAKGHSSTEITKILLLSNHIVDSCRDSIMLKLEAKNSASLVSIALKDGLID